MTIDHEWALLIQTGVLHCCLNKVSVDPEKLLGAAMDLGQKELSDARELHGGGSKGLAQAAVEYIDWIVGLGEKPQWLTEEKK